MRNKRQRVDSVAQVSIDKLVHGGQGMGVMPDGRKCFVWGALPGEIVNVQITKKKKDWAEGHAVEIIKSSADRITPREPEIYLATSPWQIIDYAKEAAHKQAILAETFNREGLRVSWQDFHQDSNEFSYRNKMEYNFWFFNDTNRVSLALHKRGSHQKVAVADSALASDAINAAGKALVAYINDRQIEARPLKSVILRSDASGKVGISLFVNDKAIAKSFADFQHPNSIFEIVYSNPKSPASVATEVLKTSDETLSDTLLGRDFKYTARSFFQVNIPVYETVLSIIAKAVQATPVKDILDIYSGVGSIGLSVVDNAHMLTMIETSAESTDQAARNMIGRANCTVVTASAEATLDYITGNELVILDPPRAGLHKDVIEKLTETKPPKIVYLSCNPSTQARDVKLLTGAGYRIDYAQGFNFFPRTPHIECLMILET